MHLPCPQGAGTAAVRACRLAGLMGFNAWVSVSPLHCYCYLLASQNEPFPCRCKGFPTPQGCGTGDVPGTSLLPLRAGLGTLRVLPPAAAALVCSSCRKLEEPWGYSGKHQGRSPRFPEKKTGSNLPPATPCGSLPGSTSALPGLRHPPDKTTGSCRSNAIGNSKGSIPGAWGLPGRSLLGCPSLLIAALWHVAVCGA